MYCDTGGWADSSRANCECSILLSSTLVCSVKISKCGWQIKAVALSVWKPLSCPVASIGQREATELSTEKLGDAVSGHLNTGTAREEHFQFERTEKKTGGLI